MKYIELEAETISLLSEDIPIAHAISQAEYISTIPEKKPVKLEVMFYKYIMNIISGWFDYK